MPQEKNYTLGRGKIYIGRETSFDVFQTVGEFYTGNSPGFSLNIEASTLDHFSSDGGINELDASVTTQVMRSGTMTLDEISPENLELFFLGSRAAIVQSATPVVAEPIPAVIPGLYYQLGVSQSNPQGVREVASITVTDDAGTPATFDEGDDYEIDELTGRLYVVPGGAILTGTNLRISYTPAASTRSRIISGSRPVRGRMRYVEDNPAGENRTFVFPLVEISPNGDLDLKGDSWRQMPFNLKVLKRVSMEAVYIDGIPQSV